MTRLNELSDAELEAIANGDHAAFTAAAAQRVGVRPELALAVRSQESRGRQSAVSPKGALGEMQLMPDTARGLGANPADPYQNIEGGVRYLKQQHDKFGSEDLALAAYNAGPGAVQKYGGIPPYAETQAYVQGVKSRDISQASDADLMRIAGSPSQGNGVSVSFPDRPDLGEASAPKRPKPTGPLPQVKAAPNATIAQDALSGFVQPFQTFGRDVAQSLSASNENARDWKPPSLWDAVKQEGARLGGMAHMAGDVLALGSAPIQAAVRPTARAMTRYLPAPTVNDGKFGRYEPRQVTDPNEKQALMEAALNTALMGATAKGHGARIGSPPPRPAPMPSMTLDELRAAKTQAYAQAEASGFRFNRSEVSKVANDLSAALEADGGMELYPEASKMVRRLSSLADKGDMTPTQLDRFRSQVGEKLMQPGSTEAHQGRMIRTAVDDLMDAGNAPEWQAARKTYQQFKKAETVTNEVDSAKLRASSTYAGGNKANAIRQELRPYVDKTSPRFIRNLSPDEAKAFRQVVDGTGGANAWRVVGKLLDARGLLGQTMQVVFGTTTHGVGNVPAAAVGALASNRSNAATLKSVDELMKLLGQRPVVPMPKVSYSGMLPQRGPSQGLVPLLSPRGAAGAGVIAAPLARVSSPRSAQKSASSGRR